MDLSNFDNHPLIHTIQDHVLDFPRWQAEVFQGTEIYLLGGLTSMLICARGQSPRAIGAAMPGHLEDLPLEGCERALLNTLFDELRERGQSDTDIATIAERMAEFVAILGELVFPSLWSSMCSDGPSQDADPMNASADPGAVQALVLAMFEMIRKRDEQRAAEEGDFVASCCVAPSEQQ